MRDTIIQWIGASFAPKFGLALALLMTVAPLAVDAVAGAAPPQPEWTERMFDRLAGPAGASVVSVVVIYFMFRMVMELIENLKVESAKKDVLIEKLVEQLGHRETH